MTRKLRLSMLLLAAAAVGCSSSPVQPSGPAPMVILRVSDSLPGSGIVNHNVRMISTGRAYFSVKSDATLTVSVTPPTCGEWTCGTVLVFSADGNRRFLDVRQGDEYRIWILSQATPPVAGAYNLEAGVTPAAD